MKCYNDFVCSIMVAIQSVQMDIYNNIRPLQVYTTCVVDMLYMYMYILEKPMKETEGKSVTPCGTNVSYKHPIFMHALADTRPLQWVILFFHIKAYLLFTAKGVVVH